ncbi:MAG: methyltransferase domain-containing protein [Pseudohongiellaceae bacterium]|nr:methyltransferase domain-containing protein [Pseudohongiellaceae bacterium]
MGWKIGLPLRKAELQASLCCPFDGASLVLQGRSLRCESGHCFDLAKEGYANLLPVQNKRSKEPGDNKEMVAARKRFLSSGIYDVVADAMCDAVLSGVDEAGFSCLDAGCGEGYYLRFLHSRADVTVDAIGLDISKWAVKAAAKADKNATYIVASNIRLPVEASSIDRLICMFGFPCYDEFHRVLAARGLLIEVEPGPEHLHQLREILYPTLKPSREDGQGLPEGFGLVRQHTKKELIQLTDEQTIQDLLLMTPHYYRAPVDGRERAAALKSLSVTIDINIRVLSKL